MQWFQPLCYGAHLAALTFPPAPFLSRAAGEEGGGCPFTFTLVPFRSSTARGRGRIIPLTYPLAPFLSHAAGEEGGKCPLTYPLAPFRSHAAGAEGWDEQSKNEPAAVHATEFTIQLTPLPQRGRGAGGEGGPHLPPTPLLSHAVGEEGG